MVTYYAILQQVLKGLKFLILFTPAPSMMLDFAISKTDVLEPFVMGEYMGISYFRWVFIIPAYLYYYYGTYGVYFFDFFTQIVTIVVSYLPESIQLDHQHHLYPIFMTLFGISIFF